MRKLFTTFALALMTLCGAYAGNNSISLKTGLSAHDHPLDNGFILRGGIGITSKKYFLSEDQVDADNGADEFVANTTFGLEIGSQWYVWRDADETMGLAINVNWFDFQAGVASDENFTSTFFDVSLIEFGPLYTYAVNEDIGIDGFFNFKPNILAGVSTNDFNDESNVLAGFGLTYAAGANFRWRALLVGIEYGFGKMKVSNTDSDVDFSEKVYTNVFKINLGVKL